MITALLVLHLLAAAIAPSLVRRLGSTRAFTLLALVPAAATAWAALRLGPLRGTDLLVSDICYRVGFTNLSNFNRHFRATTGTTPSRYRRIDQL